MNKVDLQNAQWLISSYSNGNGECIAVAATDGEVIAMRDTKDMGGPVLALPPGAWRAFVRAAASGQLDR